MAGSQVPGVLGAPVYTLEVDEGTLGPTASPKPGAVSAAAAVGDPPRGTLRARSNSGWLSTTARYAIKHAGRFGNNERMSVRALRDQQPLFRQNWKAAWAASGPTADSTRYWAMHWERVTELIEFLESPHGKLVVEMEEFLKRPTGDQKQRYITLRNGLTRHYALQRQDQLLGVKAELDEDEVDVMDRVQLEMLRALNEIAKAEIPKLRRDFWTAARRSPTDSIENRRRQRSVMLKIIFGVDPFESQAPLKPRGPDEPPDLEALFPHSVTAIMQIPLSVERQAALMGGLMRGWDPETEQALSEAKNAMEATANEAGREFKTMLAEEANQGLQDAKRRIATVGTLTGTDRLKAETMIEYDLQVAVRALLGLERQRQLLGITDKTSGTFGGVNFAWSDAENEMKRIAIEAEAIWAKWKGTAPTSVVSSVNFTGERPEP